MSISGAAIVSSSSDCDGVGVVVGQRVTERLLAGDVGAEAGLEELAGRLAGAEAGDLDLAGELAERGVDRRARTRMRGWTRGA